ncbi:protein arginine methyltransferase NDUFAF7, mitochondrial-like isoform X2 [Patiria miniata]|uniref:Protein arginine methyltransferase NDUFAF7 n=1 Tax=Patiria miniata TaxID=46514 RepID=A0A914BEB9_PATMI|nr:protein arginine methyltransferase NDUFAF7, mitochondrial-like isoform X2 [Patiria miniata]XP_038074574.1 protein arginine methyltransferase NDUFAF7, mitochondrial-like isoform X2 [Patiria miniata]
MAMTSADACRVCSLVRRMYIGGQVIQKNASSKRWLNTSQERYASTKSAETVGVQHLRRCIQTTGPLTVAEYMREVLTNPVTGYYMSQDVFGTKGDFITSPEISQMFGELIALWVIHEWTQWGQKSPLQIVELGPGRGTLADDMLRVFKQFQHVTGDSLSLHLVEVSPKMSQLQEDKLTGRQGSRTDTEEPEVNHDSPADRCSLDSGAAYKTSISKTGVPVSWYRSLKEVPKGMSCFIAHEFFDALPIHKFQKTEKGWREVLVDVDSDDNGPHHLRFVLSPAPTPASTVYLQSLTQGNDRRDHVEVCPEGGAIVQEMAHRVSEHGGMSLIVDYGHDGTKTDTLRGFKKHRLHDVLCEPGTADLTADVDFSYFRQIVQGKASTYGPITQESFLKAMGIETRLKMLLKSATAEQSKGLLTGYRMLTDPAQMGERFKCFAMMPPNRGTQSGQARPPAAFPS